MTHIALDSAAESVRQYCQEKRVVLLGSSLVMSPLWSTDIRSFPAVQDCWHHHRWLWLEKLLEKAGVTGVRTVGFGIPGLFVSDAYLLADKLFRNQAAPDLIVYGIAPRDLIDGFLAAHTQTPVFERFFELEDLPRLRHLYFSSPQEEFDFVLGKVVYLYGKRERYRTRAARTADRVLLSVLQHQSDKATMEEDRRGQMFWLEENRPFVWARSIREYKERYRRLNTAQFHKQKQFLSSLLKLCRKRNIKVLLVNMPLTPDNLGLMPVGFYSQYLSAVRDIAAANGCQLIDPQNHERYPDDHFYDTVHLNAVGGERLARAISFWIVRQHAGEMARLEAARAQMH